MIWDSSGSVVAVLPSSTSRNFEAGSSNKADASFRRLQHVSMVDASYIDGLLSEYDNWRYCAQN